MYFINEFDIFMLSENKNLLVNYLSGAVDIIDYKTNVAILNKNLALLDDSIIQLLYSRNYIFDTKEKYSAYTDKLNYKLLDSERKQKPNFLLIPTYNCNLDCTYCYEKNYVIEKFNGNMHFSKNITDSLFTAIEELSKENELQSNNNDTSEFTNITLMGGEPLFSDNDTILSCIFNKLNKEKYYLSIITNGYELDKYIPQLTKLNLNFIQITLDGTKKNHDAKRFDKQGNGTYNTIMKNIELALKEGICVEVRTNVDIDNILNLPKLAKCLYQMKQRYSNLKPYIYILQDGGCSGNKTMINEVESLKMLLELEHLYPEVNVFRKTFHGIDFINSIINNKPFEPKASNCAACKNQYILDTNGNIYKCWFGVGNSIFKVGHSIPDLEINKIKDDTWKKRNILHLSNCNQCNYRYICGGGCASRTSVDIETGIRQEKCADFKEIFSIYFSYLYGGNEQHAKV